MEEQMKRDTRALLFDLKGEIPCFYSHGELGLRLYLVPFSFVENAYYVSNQAILLLPFHYCLPAPRNILIV